MGTINETLKYAKETIDGLDIEQAKLACGCRKNWTYDNTSNEHLDIVVIYEDNISLFLSFKIVDSKLKYEHCILSVGDETWQLD